MSVDIRLERITTKAPPPALGTHEPIAVVVWLTSQQYARLVRVAQMDGHTPERAALQLIEAYCADFDPPPNAKWVTEPMEYKPRGRSDGSNQAQN